MAIEGVVRALDDGTYWVTQSKSKIRASKMTKRHAENVVGWLERRATILHNFYCLKMVTGPQPQGMDPKDWLNKTPLVVNLRERSAKRLTKVA